MNRYLSSIEVTIRIPKHWPGWPSLEDERMLELAKELHAFARISDAIPAGAVTLEPKWVYYTDTGAVATPVPPLGLAEANIDDILGD